MSKFWGGRAALNSNVPLELQKSDFGQLDEMQNKMICKLNALDLVLLENANELFRMLMQEGDDNDNLEKALNLVKNKNSRGIYLPSRTFDIKMNSKDNWVFDQKNTNKRLLHEYICECSHLIKNKVKNDSIIYTIIGLDLGEGGHYGALVCDVKLREIHIFDSMSGAFDGQVYTAATQSIFKSVAKKIFIGDDSYTGILNPDLDGFKFKNVYTKYILQPTGGFEDFVAPILSKLDNPKNKKAMNDINLQHTESQNHFCYMWSIWFCHIYLKDGIKLYKKIINKFEKNEVLTLVVIKKYILGIIQFLDDEVEQKNFFYKRFPQIWSNHEDPWKNNFGLYEISWCKPKTIEDCLNDSINNLEVTKIESTQYVLNNHKCK